MLAPASITCPTVVTFDEGLTATNATSNSIEVAFRRMWNGLHPEYSVKINGRVIVPEGYTSERLYFVASVRFEFINAGENYVQLTDYYDISPEIFETSWIDISHPINTVEGGAYILYQTKPDEINDPTESHASKSFLSGFYSWSYFLEGIGDDPHHLQNVDKSAYATLDKMTLQAQSILRDHECFSADKLRELKAGNSEEVNTCLDRVIQFIESSPEAASSVGAVPLHNLVCDFSKLEKLEVLSLKDGLY